MSERDSWGNPLSAPIRRAEVYDHQALVEGTDRSFAVFGFNIDGWSPIEGLELPEVSALHILLEPTLISLPRQHMESWADFHSTSSTIFQARLPQVVDRPKESESASGSEPVVKTADSDDDDLYGGPTKKRKLDPQPQVSVEREPAPGGSYLSVIDDKGDLNVRIFFGCVSSRADLVWQIYELDDFKLVWSAAAVNCLPEILQRLEETEAPAFGDVDEAPAGRTIEQHRFFPADGDDTVHLVVRMISAVPKLSLTDDLTGYSGERRDGGLSLRGRLRRRQRRTRRAARHLLHQACVSTARPNPNRGGRPGVCSSRHRAL